MEEDRNSLLPILIVPGLHLLLCLSTGLASQRETLWFFLELIDLPESIMFHSLGADALSPFVQYTVLGTLWWLGVSVVFRLLYRNIVTD